MNDTDGLRIRPDEVTDVTKQLDDLAERVQHVMETEKANLTVIASGNDEVSQRVAQTSNEVHANFTKASDAGVTEMHEIAATLRSHSGRIESQDLA